MLRTKMVDDELVQHCPCPTALDRKHVQLGHSSGTLLGRKRTLTR
jgi:hypothetical protein